jgi:hypothetical protein
MKRVFIGLFITAAILTTGCLGNAPEQIIGNWHYENAINPAQHNMNWNFLDNGEVIFYNATTGVSDTGKYEMYMDGTHKVVKIKNTTIEDAYMGMNGEWHIVHIDFDILTLGLKDYGFQQRDLVR